MDKPCAFLGSRIISGVAMRVFLCHYQDMAEFGNLRAERWDRQKSNSSPVNSSLRHEKSRLGTTPDGFFRYVRTPLANHQKAFGSTEFDPSVPSFWPKTPSLVKQIWNKTPVPQDKPAALHAMTPEGIGVLNRGRQSVSLT